MMNIKIVSISRVLNEADVIEAFVRHTCAFVQHQFIMDNGSTDGTVEILEALKKEGFPITVFQSRAVTYNEGSVVTALYNLATQEQRPDWVICFDADEFIDDRQIPGGLRNHLAALKEANSPIDCIKIPMVNYVATSKDDPSDNNVATRITRRTAPSDTYKIIVRGCFEAGDLSIQHGSHWATLKSRDIVEITNEKILLAHYSERSTYQYIVKFVRGWSKVLATGQAEVSRNTAYHYKPAYEILRDKPEALLRNKQFMDFKNENQEVIFDPIDYKGSRLIHTKQSDEAMRAVRCLMGFLEEITMRHGIIMDKFPEVNSAVREWELATTKLF
mgnify:FL=1|nr:glycosyltransferase family 2 protein [uncultured Acidocella sp.]